VTFPRTLAALRGDRDRGPLVLLVAIAILAGWLTWGLAAEISIYRSSVRARIEVSPAPTQVATPVAGRVTEVHLEVGARVAAGALLVELDATPERIAADKARARAAALAPEVDSVDRELVAEDDARRNGGLAELGAEREVLAKARAAEAELIFAEQELAREQKLANTGASTLSVRDRADTTVKQRRAAFEAIQHESSALGASHRERGDGRRARREQLERQHAELANELAAARAEIERLDHEVLRRTIRAPVAGTLGEVIAVRPGALVHDGDVIATVVPDGTLHAVAEYGVAALGRLAPGQLARIRLDGFPWTRYGTASARVARVASELRDGTIRVELELTGETTLPLRHGMTGTVDVEIERASPLALLLRAVGDGLDGGP